jgi:hypothetical protein
MIGAPGENNQAGGVNVLYGSVNGLKTQGNQFWTQNSFGIADYSEAGDRFGASLTTGDFNKDGFTDLAIGAPGENNNAGQSHILYGSAVGLRYNNSQLWSQNSLGIAGISATNDGFGSSMTAADFDGDGFADLAVGVPGDAGIGSVQVLQGSQRRTFDLSFNTSNQSIWSTGSTYTYNHNKFLGVSWNKSYSGSIDPLGLPELGLYASTSGQVGLQSKLSVNGGSVSASLPIDLWFDLPGQVRSGQTVTLSSGFALDKAASFSTIGPKAAYALDFLFNMKANAGGIYNGTRYSAFDHNIYRNKNLLKIDSTTSSYYLSESQLKGYGSFDLRLPRNLNAQDNASDGKLSAQISDNFFNANLDLDKVATALFQAFGVPIPSMEGSKDLPLPWLPDPSFNYDILDVDLVSKLSLQQKLDVSVDGLTGQLILENGQAINFTVGQDVTFVVPEGIGNTLDFKAVLNLDANFINKTSLAYDVDVALKALSASVGWGTASVGIGPLVNQTFDVLNGAFDLYNKSFDLGGLNSQSVNFSVAAA